MPRLKSPKLTPSLRRFRREGKLAILGKYALVNLHTLLKGPITTELFDYPMGGMVARNNGFPHRNKLQRQFKQYLKSLSSSLSANQ